MLQKRYISTLILWFGLQCCRQQGFLYIQEQPNPTRNAQPPQPMIASQPQRSQWRITTKGPIDIKNETKRLLPHLSPQFINQESTFLNQKVIAIEIGDDIKKWTVLRTSSEVQGLVAEVEDDFKCNIKDFDKGITLALNANPDKTYFKQFFEIQFEQLRKIASMKMKKKSGARYTQKCFCLCQPSWLMWSEKKFIITKESILYYNQKKQYMEQNIQFTNFFKYETGIAGDQQYGITIKTNYRNLKIKATNFRNYFNFVYFLNQARKQQEVVHHFRFESFAPVRDDNRVEFIIDGENYFRKVAQALEAAKIQVLITGWWVSPEVYLRRNSKQNYLTCRLDHIIKSIAARGVKVYIIVYWQSSFLSNDSAYTHSVFRGIPNVKIMRHPDIVLPSFWSHHEKLVIVDQQMAFIGGIDLCYGRFDNKKHSLEDNSVERYPGLEYNNARIRDFSNLSQYKKDGVSRDLPRLPWHDVSVFVIGPCVKDVCNHFIEYWNFVSFQTKQFKKQAMLMSHGSKAMVPVNNEKSKGYLERMVTLNINRINNFFHRKKDQGSKIKNQLQQPQKQTSQARQLRLKKTQTLNIEREKIPSSSTSLFRQSQLPKDRKKSQQIETMKEIPRGLDEESIQQSIKNKIIERKLQQERKLEVIDLLKNKSSQRQQEGPQNNNSYISPETKKVQQMRSIALKRKETMGASSYKCQILRSASKWSIGCRSSQTESSIHEAYIELIKSAQRFIYIENQYFISSVKEEDVVQNRIASAIFERIRLAHERGQPFYVLVIMPLIPAFPGQISAGEASIPRGIMHWQYRTISRHKNSLFSRIQEFAHPDKYIKFYSLRSHGMIYDTPHTEILYVHSKLMVVDDWKAIIGSANINDRSLNGDRDSEVCILIQGELKCETPQLAVQGTQGKRYRYNSTIHHLRTELWQQHFGIPYTQMDPLNEEHRTQIATIAKNNTEIYRRVFGCYPDDSVGRMKDIGKLRAAGQADLYAEEIKKVRGHVVEFPLEFLNEESLTNFTPDAISI